MESFLATGQLQRPHFNVTRECIRPVVKHRSTTPCIGETDKTYSREGYWLAATQPARCF